MLRSEKEKAMNANTDNGSERESRKYETPRLTEYGSVAELTQSGATISANDGQTHRARRP